MTDYKWLIKNLKAIALNFSGTEIADENGKRTQVADVALYAADAIEELSKPKWISVSERLPKRGEVVLVYTTHNMVYDDRIKLDCRVISNKTDIPYWSCNEGRVLAWMPLPEPPKEERE